MYTERESGWCCLSQGIIAKFTKQIPIRIHSVELETDEYVQLGIHIREGQLFDDSI